MAEMGVHFVHHHCHFELIGRPRFTSTSKNNFSSDFGTPGIFTTGDNKNRILIITRKVGNYSDVLPLKAARRDSISNLTFWGFKSELQTNPMLFHLESLWDATLVPHRGCAMDSDKMK